jgi:hypothetical protein
MGSGPVAFGQAGAELQMIWRCVDPTGKTHVTNIKDETVGKDCKVIQTQRVNVLPPQTQSQSQSQTQSPKPATKSPAGFPKETSGERATARDRQRAALESELASEEALLTKAKAELAEQESIRGGDEKNYAKVLERLQKYKDNVELHQKNATELRKELGKLR